MPKFSDITNQRFGRLVAIQPVGSSTGGTRWECRCGCGKIRIVSIGDLRRRGDTQSCGRCEDRPRYTKHPLYRIWVDMRDRCNRPTHPEYPNYGRRGIKTCKRWDGVANFISDILAEIGERPPGLTLDRIKNDGNYEPGNVRWATRKEQVDNRRDPKQWKLAKSNTTGYRGVSPQGGKWKAEITIDGIRRYLGLFKTAEEAAAAVKNAV